MKIRALNPLAHFNPQILIGCQKAIEKVQSDCSVLTGKLLVPARFALRMHKAALKGM